MHMHIVHGPGIIRKEKGGGGGKGSLEKCNEHNNHLVNVFLFTFFSSFVLTGFMTYIL